MCGLDAGTAYTGAIITRSYDSLLVKVTAWSPTAEETIARMHRALWEFRIRGVVTNLRFLDQLITHPAFAQGEYTTRFIDTTPELFHWPRKRDRATRILKFIGETIVNGNVGDQEPGPAGAIRSAAPAAVALQSPPPPGTQQKLEELGPERFAKWMLGEQRVLLTDTTMRDAHQSLLATRVRTQDMVAIAPYYATLLPQLFSMECWGGATFDVAMRFLSEDPWQRLAMFRERMPNLLLQMLLRSANAVGYTNYPDNVVRFFVKRAAAGGIDVFRIFDSLNWVENMRVSIDAVLESGKLCEAAICYSGNLSDPREKKYTLDYYLKLARELRDAGTHVLGIKDMGGQCRPEAARILVEGAEGRDRLADSLPHARHERHRRGERAGCSRSGRQCRGLCDRLDERSHLSAQHGLDCGGVALRPARYGNRSRQDPAAVVVLGADAKAVRRVRKRHPLGRLRSVRARHAGRSVHQPARAGALAGHR